MLITAVTPRPDFPAQQVNQMGLASVISQPFAEIALRAATNRQHRHIRAVNAPPVQDAAIVETAIGGGVIVPTRRLIGMIQNRIDGRHGHLSPEP